MLSFVSFLEIRLYLFCCIITSLMITSAWGQNLTGDSQLHNDLISADKKISNEDPVLRILRERVDEHGHAVGIVAGIIRGINRYGYNYGTLHQGTIRRVSPMTVFEIGQLSSLYTTAMLSIMIQQGDLNLNDKVETYLPETVKMPSATMGKPILLEHLATHTSGLPDLPGNLVSTDQKNPLKDYTVDLMYDFLTSYADLQPSWEDAIPEQGEQVEEDSLTVEGDYLYSALGMGLLGHILELVAGKSYDNLMRELIHSPIKLANTASVPTASMRTYTATGHDDGGRPIEPWSNKVLLGGRGLRSNLLDMMALVSANMGIIYSLPEEFNEEDSTRYDIPIEELILLSNRYHMSFDDLIIPRKRTNISDVEMAMGWKVKKDYRGRNIHWLTGQTNGFFAFAGFVKEWKKGVVVLANSSVSIEDIGFHLLSSRNPINPPSKNVAPMSPAAYKVLVGTYKFMPEFIIDISFVDGKLYGQPPGQPKSELIPMPSGDFYLKEEDAQITFVKNEIGEVDYFLFLQDGRTHRAQKINGGN